jgi:hypothetical protein
VTIEKRISGHELRAVRLPPGRPISRSNNAYARLVNNEEGRICRSAGVWPNASPKRLSRWAEIELHDRRKCENAIVHCPFFGEPLAMGSNVASVLRYFDDPTHCLMKPCLRQITDSPVVLSLRPPSGRLVQQHYRLGTFRRRPRQNIPVTTSRAAAG